MCNINKPLFLVLMLFWIVACSSHIGLTRTSYDSFETVKFKSFGIQMLLPIKEKNWRSNYYMKVYDTEAYKKSTNSEEMVFFFIHTGFQVFLLSRIIF